MKISMTCFLRARLLQSTTGLTTVAFALDVYL
jgi:hypothetical protein